MNGWCRGVQRSSVVLVGRSCRQRRPRTGRTAATSTETRGPRTVLHCPVRQPFSNLQAQRTYCLLLACSQTASLNSCLGCRSHRRRVDAKACVSCTTCVWCGDLFLLVRMHVRTASFVLAGLVVVDGVTIPTPLEQAYARAVVDVPVLFATMACENDVSAAEMAWNDASDFEGYCNAQFASPWPNTTADDVYVRTSERLSRSHNNNVNRTVVDTHAYRYDLHITQTVPSSRPGVCGLLAGGSMTDWCISAVIAYCID